MTDREAKARAAQFVQRVTRELDFKGPGLRGEGDPAMIHTTPGDLQALRQVVELVPRSHDLNPREMSVDELVDSIVASPGDSFAIGLSVDEDSNLRARYGSVRADGRTVKEVLAKLLTKLIE